MNNYDPSLDPRPEFVSDLRARLMARARADQLAIDRETQLRAEQARKQRWLSWLNLSLLRSLMKQAGENKLQFQAARPRVLRPVMGNPNPIWAGSQALVLTLACTLLLMLAVFPRQMPVAQTVLPVAEIVKSVQVSAEIAPPTQPLQVVTKIEPAQEVVAAIEIAPTSIYPLTTINTSSTAYQVYQDSFTYMLTQPKSLGMTAQERETLVEALSDPANYHWEQQATPSGPLRALEWHDC